MNVAVLYHFPRVAPLPQQQTRRAAIREAIGIRCNAERLDCWQARACIDLAETMYDSGSSAAAAIQTGINQVYTILAAAMPRGAA